MSDSVASSAVLSAEVARLVSKGWSVADRTESQVVLTRNKKIKLISNLLLCLVTGGVWLIYVIYRALNRKKETLVLSVDTNGVLSRR